jgi:cytidylate kinase
MVITIDGPAGAGKSTAARGLAARLGFRFLDTGAMYRALAVAGLRAKIDWTNRAEVARLAREASIRFGEQGQVILNDQDVTDAIRATEIVSVVHHVADNREIRRRLVDLQRQITAGGNYVTEGRDQGTVAFPDSPCKIFLTASPDERARRRLAELKAIGDRGVKFADVLTAQNERDRLDQAREFGRLLPADDAIEVITDNLTLEEVVDRLVEIVHARCQLPDLQP